MILELHQM